MRAAVVMAMASLLISAPVVSAQDPGAVTPEQMAEYMALAAPGRAHERLAALTGTWDQEIVFALAAGETQKVTAVAENRMVLGGRFLISEARGVDPFMGQTIESVTIFGFDRRAGAWTVSGFDSFGTYHVDAAGQTSEDATDVIMSGVNADPRMKRAEPFEWVIRFVDADTYVTEIIFEMADGTKHTVVAITHRRRQ